MIEALEKPLSYPDLSEEKRVLCQKYFDVLSKSMLKALKKDSIQLQSDLTIRGLASFYAIKLTGNITSVQFYSFFALSMCSMCIFINCFQGVRLTKTKRVLVSKFCPNLSTKHQPAWDLTTSNFFKQWPKDTQR